MGGPFTIVLHPTSATATAVSQEQYRIHSSDIYSGEMMSTGRLVNPYSTICLRLSLNYHVDDKKVSV